MTTAEDVRVAVTGGVYTAPDGTALPTTVDGALNGAFVELGYLSEEGITQSEGTETTDIKAWQNGDIVRKVQTAHDLTFAMSFMETNEDTLEAYYGNYDAGTVKIRGEVGVRKPWVFNVVDGTKRLRLVIPDGQVTERGDIQYVNGGAVMYPVTISAFAVTDPDDDELTLKAIIYTDLDGS